MTLDSAVVDARKVFAPGQLGVGIGRVRDQEGLSVVNFDSAKCFKHPNSVKNFYSREPIEVDDMLECCRSTGIHQLLNAYCLFYYCEC